MDCQTPPRTPLSLLCNTQRAPMIGTCSPSSSSLSQHEALIRSLLNKPFKIPIPGYTGGGYGRSLGVRRSGGRQPLHDPLQEGALVLYCPPELSEHEKLKVFFDNRLPLTGPNPILCHLNVSLPYVPRMSIDLTSSIGRRLSRIAEMIRRY